MKTPLHGFLAALQLQDMHDELQDLRAEVDRLRKVEAEFREYVETHIASSNQTTLNWIDFLDKVVIAVKPKSTETSQKPSNL